ncbi:hypothetical protein EI42_00909 [Thermosporothrix hazakensis]|uniref:Lipoprotein n=1 Tax=Thermosporothrix hazakensis TaxID=644383 RepID=A0A326UE21_THEHA|nr:hypothetical protein [Thermosporothrix hazakensis]PZW36728.1 hypothetical protein EI42_00909 [Thermosporothrix hazakensis]GCE47378.1 hypothetical protein KTH_22470 [Thermosporothrix hazakensis]
MSLLTKIRFSLLVISIACILFFTACTNNNTTQQNPASTQQPALPQQSPTTGQNQQPQQPTTAQTIEFTGTVKQASKDSLSVTMPNGKELAMRVTEQTRRDKVPPDQPTVGQLIKVKTIADNQGNFVANKLELPDDEDRREPGIKKVHFEGITTSPVGKDNILHFKVGNNTYDLPIDPSRTRIEDFANAQSIPGKQPVDVEVIYDGTRGAVTKVDNGLD